MNKYKAVISDLDGTLLNENGDVSFYTKKIIKKLSLMEIKFIIATGRCFETANLIKKQLGIDCCLITSNGAEIYDEDENLIYANYIPENIVEKLIKLQVDSSYKIFIVQEKVFYTEVQSGFLDTSFTYKVTSFENQKWNKTINFYYQHKDRNKLVQLEKFLKEIFKEKLEICISTDNRLDIMNKNINKGEAVKQILGRYKLSLKKAIAFGDQLNDLEMLKVVEKGFCLKNACDDLKRYINSENIIGVNSQDSVAKKIEELFFLRE